ncbi:MAG: hypothetical protein JKY56_19800 [Kofleriaceae bacterium]|nr:hypothetical protein [Kofleriaceae bacterium]
MPPRRRKNGLERTAPVEIARVGIPPVESVETLGSTKLKASTDRSSVVVETSAPTASSLKTAIPVPSRTERDRKAALSSGVAPVLAKEVSEPIVTEIDDASGGWPAPATQAAVNSEDWSLQSPESTDPSVVEAPIVVPAIPATPTEWESPRTSEVIRTSAAAPAIPAAPAMPAAPAIPAAPTVSASANWPVPEQSIEKLQPFKAAEVMAIPGVPEAGLLAALKYTIAFARARWQRRGAIKSLRSQIGLDTGVLDGILGTLGRQARSLKIETSALAAENRSIDEAEKRRQTADHDCSGLSNRQAEENSKFADIEGERVRKVDESGKALEAAQGEVGSLEAQKRGWKDKRKSLESRQKGYLKAADNRSAEADKHGSGAQRDELRHSAENLRADAAALESECDDVDRCMRTLDGPLSEKTARVDALRSDLDAAKRALTDLREGHRHRLAEIEAEQGRKSRELAQAEAEIQRRLVTLGTIVNLNRVDRGEFADLYAQIDTLRGAIGARSNEIDKLSAERHAFDKASLVRGACVLGGIVVLFLALLAIIFSG